MPFNPSPKVADCRDIARKWDKRQIIIIGIDATTMEVVTFGQTKQLCSETKLLGDIAYAEIMHHLEAQALISSDTEADAKAGFAPSRLL